MICSLADYRKITRDTTNYDGDVLYSLEEAQEYVERYTGRLFELGTYTENLTIHPNGRVYPRALPLVSVSSPSTASIVGAAITRVQGPWIDPDFTLNYLPYGEYYYVNGPGYLKTTVTYVGGYEKVPFDIKKAVAQLAHFSLQPNPLVGIPTGASRIQVGDVEILSTKNDLGNGIPDYIEDVLDKWKRLEV